MRCPTDIFLADDERFGGLPGKSSYPLGNLRKSPSPPSYYDKKASTPRKPFESTVHYVFDNKKLFRPSEGKFPPSSTHPSGNRIQQNMPSCSRDFCSNQGVCFDDGRRPRRPSCDCDLTSFTGPKCADG